jgi:hypothetical protein
MVNTIVALTPLSAYRTKLSLEPRPGLGRSLTLAVKLSRTKTLY